MSKKQEYLRIDTGKNEGVYQIEDLRTLTPRGKWYACPCCGKAIKPALDIIQWGFWDDNYVTYFLCRPCVKAFRYSYVVPPATVDILSAEGIDGRGNKAE